MHDWRLSTGASLGLAMILAIYSSSCAPTGVGDPCEPEVQPEGGFRPGETLIETSSLQCRTRICMHFHPENSTDGYNFCTQSCETDADCTADWYESGPGQGDEPGARCLAEVNIGAPAVRGKYCVPNRATVDIVH